MGKASAQGVVFVPMRQGRLQKGAYMVSYAVSYAVISFILCQERMSGLDLTHILPSHSEQIRFGRRASSNELLKCGHMHDFNSMLCLHRTRRGFSNPVAEAITC